MVFFVLQSNIQAVQTPFNETYEKQMKVVTSPKTSANKRTMAAFVVANTLANAGPENASRVMAEIDKILKASEIRTLDEADRVKLRAAAILAGEGSPQAAMYVQRRLEADGVFDQSLASLKAEGTYLIDESKEGNKRLTNIFNWAYSPEVQRTFIQRDVDDLLSFARSLPEDKRLPYYVGAVLASDNKVGLDAYTMSQLNQGAYEQANSYINAHSLRRSSFVSPAPQADERKEEPRRAEPTEPVVSTEGAPKYVPINPTAVVDWRPGTVGIRYPSLFSNQGLDVSGLFMEYQMGNLLDMDWSSGYLNAKYPNELDYLTDARKYLGLLFGARILAEEFRQSNNTPDKEFIDLMKVTLKDARAFLTDTYFSDDSWFAGSTAAQAKALYDRAMNGDFQAFLDFITIWRNSPANPMRYSTAGLDIPKVTINKTNIRPLGQFDIVVNVSSKLSEELLRGINGERSVVPAYFDLNAEIYKRMKKSTTYFLNDRQEVEYEINDNKLDHPGIYTLRFATAIFFNGYGHFVRPGLSYSQIDYRMGAELGVFKRDQVTGYSDPLKLFQTADNKTLNLDYSLMVRAPSFKDRLITNARVALEGVESLFMRGEFFNVRPLIDVGLQMQYRPQEIPSNLLIFVPRLLIPIGSQANEKGHYISPAVSVGYDVSRSNVFIQPELRAMYGGIELYGAWQNIIGQPHTEAKLGLRIDPEEFMNLFRSATIQPKQPPSP